MKRLKLLTLSIAAVSWSLNQLNLDNLDKIAVTITHYAQMLLTLLGLFIGYLTAKKLLVETKHQQKH
jgi:uncharacterized membrane protein YwzB